MSEGSHGVPGATGAPGVEGLHAKYLFNAGLLHLRRRISGKPFESVSQYTDFIEPPSFRLLTEVFCLPLFRLAGRNISEVLTEISSSFFCCAFL